MRQTFWACSLGFLAAGGGSATSEGGVLEADEAVVMAAAEAVLRLGWGW
jgi:hypothetical protein